MHNRILFISLAFLALLCFQTTALPLFEGSFLRKSPIMNAFATSSGVIDLKKESNFSSTFYVEADLSNLSSSSEKSSSDSVKMMISLVNDDTLVVENCLGFSSYDCSKHHCKKQGTIKMISFPWFNATVEASQSELYLDYKHWSLNSANLYIARSCRTGDNLTSFGSGFSGVLGFGTGSGVVDDFTSGPIFSIFIESDLSSGKLLFKKDTDKYAHSTSSPITLSTSYGWIFDAQKLQVGSETLYIDSFGFDINSDAIGIPAYRWEKFMKGFTGSGIWCKESNYRPYCYTRRELKNLPTIYIYTNSYQTINIAPEISMTLDKDTGVYKYFYLNFKAISPSLTGKNYVTPDLKDYLLLDANFLSYFYTVFDGLGSGNKIHLYASINAPAPSPTPEKPSSDSNKAAVIILVAVGIMLLVGCCYCCCGASGVQDGEKRTLVNETTEDFYTPPSQNKNQGEVVYNANPYKSDQSKGLYQAY